MIFCKRCGYEGVYTGKKCPDCLADIALTKEELSEYERELGLARERGEYETVIENTRILADFGNTEAEREYAIMLERGRLVPRDLDKAMEYFCRAAEKHDAPSAFRYSRLISRVSDEAGSFWLCYSALLGYQEAFLPAAEEYDRLGKRDTANYYYYRAAACDEVDAIVALAEKYYNGDALEKCPEYAKWYMDKLSFPPLYAIKFALKLRTLTPKEPPAIRLSDYDGLLKMLYDTAKSKSYDTAACKIAEVLADRGDKEAAIDLALMYLEGRGTAKNTEAAMHILSRTAALGSSTAYAMLGSIYIVGKFAERDTRLGVSYLKKSAELGNALAYEALADYYHSPECEERNVALAHELYEKAARGGSSTAKEKADRIAQVRKELFERGKAQVRRDPKEAYRLFAISTAMGHLPSLVELGSCYLYGIGTKIDPRTAHYWYKEAAEAGYMPAYLPLGICYGRGIGTAFDFNEATALLKKAQENGIAEAERELFRLYEQKKKSVIQRLYSSGVRLVYQQKYEAAARLLEVAAHYGSARAAYVLGTLYEFGRGVEYDKERARALYKTAADGGFDDYDRHTKQALLRMMKRIL